MGIKIDKIRLVQKEHGISLIEARNRLVACNWDKDRVAATMRIMSHSDAEFCASSIRNKTMLATRDGEALLRHLVMRGIIHGQGQRYQWGEHVTPLVRHALDKLINEISINSSDVLKLKEAGFDEYGYLINRPKIIINN